MLKKISKKYILLGFVGVLLVVGIVTGGEKEKELKELERQGYGGSENEYFLNARIDGKDYDLNVNVSARQLEHDELQHYFDLAFDYIVEEMPGENESLDRVCTNLVFPETVGEYRIAADYSPEDYTYIDCYGEVNSEEADVYGNECLITVGLEYDGVRKEYQVSVTVFPPKLSEAELIQKEIGEAIALADKNNVGADTVALPSEINGRPVSFYEKAESKLPLVMMLFLLGGLFIYYKRVVVPKNFEKKKEEQMGLDYSEIVTKLSLLMGAGMSGAKAFEKMGQDYQKTLGGKKPKIRYAYEEIVAAGNRLKTGASEATVYSDFGRKCHLHSYIKLGSLMTQNIKKGGEGFINLLKNEADDSFIERKAFARQRGEAAGTKLLLPMIMQLMVVLIIIIVPAFMSFS